MGQNSGGISEPFTPIPSVLIDRVMPTLKDTEWRLICVIVRQTLGWSQNGKRKQRDWLSQRQLMARTGRNSAALSAALDVLVRRRLVNAWDDAGELLLTSQARRKHQGRIYYGLCEQALQHDEQDAKTPLRKANTTKETRDKRKPLLNESPSGLKPRDSATPSIYTGWVRASDVAAKRWND